jgi:hypothetical protein
MFGTRLGGLAVLAILLGALPAMADQPVAIVLKNHRFTPSSITVPAGTRFRIEVTNMDSTVAELESYDMHFEKIMVGNGAKVHVFAGPLHLGVTYKFFDDYHPDVARGTITAVAAKD